MQMQLGGIQNGGKLRSEKVKYKERKLRFLLFFFLGADALQTWIHLSSECAEK